jgi:hypothetical protein
LSRAGSRTRWELTPWVLRHNVTRTQDPVVHSAQCMLVMCWSFHGFDLHSFVCPLCGLGSCSSTGSLCDLDQVNFCFCMVVVLIVIVVRVMVVVNF